MKIHTSIFFTLIMGFYMSSTVLAGKRVINSPVLPASLAPYSPAILVTSLLGDQTLYISGILPRLSAQELVEDPAAATTLAMDHIAALLKEASMSWADVVDVIIILRDINDFRVVSEAYGKYLNEQKVVLLPARACFQGGRLPLNAVLEIKATAVKGAAPLNLLPPQTSIS